MSKAILSKNPWQQSILTTKEFAQLDVKTQLEYLCQFGILAPTSHNSVPQRFRLQPDTQGIEIVLDRKFVLPYSDRVGRQAMVSIGCVVESLVLAARWYGWGATVEYPTVIATAVYPHVAGQERYVTVANVAFLPESAQSKAMVESALNWPQLLLERKVIRAEYDRTQTLTEQQMTQFKNLVSEHFPTVELHVLSGTLSLRALGKFQENADRFVMENQQFAHELGLWLLPNDEKKTPYAMRGVEFGFDDAFANTVHQGLVGKQRLLPDQVAAFAKGGKVGVESSAAVAVLSVEKDDQPARMEAGRAYLQSSTWLWQEGFANAVHAGITEVDWVTTMFAASMLHTRRRPVAVFRIGKPKREVDWKRPHSYRPELQEVTLSE